MNGRKDRRQQILEVLVAELEARPGDRITTARLAAAVGVSEAALYRHFPSKARMFEALIEFAEQAVFALFNQVMDEQHEPGTRLFHLTTALLGFAGKNPGIARLLYGDILVGENVRLRQRVQQFYARVETQFRQVLREARWEHAAGSVPDMSEASRLLLTVVVGRIDQFVREGFAGSPAAGWDAQWRLLSAGLWQGAARSGD